MALLDRVEAASALDSISLPLSSMTGGATVFAFRPRLFVVLDIVAGAGDDEVKSSDEVVEVASTGFPSSFSISTSSFSLSSAAAATAAATAALFIRFLPARFFSTGEADAFRCAAMRFWSKYSEAEDSVVAVDDEVLDNLELVALLDRVEAVD